MVTDPTAHSPDTDGDTNQADRKDAAVSENEVQILPLDWRSQAACRPLPTELFYVSGHSDIARYDQERAKAICAECPVCEDCLAFALETEEAFGVWGGTTPDERRALRRGTSFPGQRTIGE